MHVAISDIYKYIVWVVSLIEGITWDGVNGCIRLRCVYVSPRRNIHYNMRVGMDIFRYVW